MTYKEAIDTIEYARAFNARNTPLMRALDMAVEALSELEQLKRERNAAVKELFHWTRCPVCKHWSPADEWCEKHDRHADSFDGCDNPEWRGIKEGAEDGCN